MGTVEVREDIHASADRIWELIGDPTQMTGLTAECTAMKWIGASTTPNVGAQFRGSNQLGRRRWSTTCTITRYQPGVEIAWDVRSGPISVAEWNFRIDGGSSEGSTTVTEQFVDHRSSVFRALGPFIRGVKDNDAHNRNNITETLNRIKARAEA